MSPTNFHQVTGHLCLGEAPLGQKIKHYIISSALILLQIFVVIAAHNHAERTAGTDQFGFMNFDGAFETQQKPDDENLIALCFCAGLISH